MPQPTQGYTQGNDMLVLSGGKATGHASSHTIDASAETKAITCKPPLSEPIGKSMWDDKIVTKKSVTVKCDGLVNYGETESGAGSLLALYDAAEPVQLKGVHRKNGAADTDPDVFMEGDFVITSLNVTANSGEEVTYSATFESTGPVTFTPAKFPGYVAPTQSLNAPAAKEQTIDAPATKLTTGAVKAQQLTAK